MIKSFGIKNFKSVKNLSLECKKVNLFIGEPNVGKSNIIEALGFFLGVSIIIMGNSTSLLDLSGSVTFSMMSLSMTK